MKRVLRILGKTLLWAVLGIVGLLTLAIVLLYIPPIQDFAVGKALETLNSKGDMKIEVGRFRLTFPLKIAIDSASMRTPGMDIFAGRAEANVSLMPLLKGEIRGERVELRRARFDMGGPDSAFQMNAALEYARVLDGGYNLVAQDIAVDRLLARGADVTITIRPDSVPEPEKTDSVSSPLTIALNHGVLENIRYRMSIDPSITDLGAYMGRAVVNLASFDMLAKLIKANDITVDSIDAKYIYPSAEYLAAHPLPPEAAADSAAVAASVPWTVTCDKVRISGGNALYALDGAKPVGPNFDLDYIQATEIGIAVDSFVNRGTAVRAPIRGIHARERCGVRLNLSGLFDMDSSAIRAENISLTTGASRVSLDAMMGMGATDAKAMPVALKLTADLANEDLRRLAPAQMSRIADMLPPYQPLLAEAELKGTMADLDVKSVKVEIPQHAGIKASGKIADLTDINKAVGNVALSGWIADGKWAKPLLLDAKSGRGINIPPLTVDGEATLDRGVIDGNLSAHTGSGRLALEALWNNRATAYDIDLRADDFPVQAIMPDLGLRDVTAVISASGQGFDVMSPKTDIDAKVDLVKATYQGHQYQDVTLTANLAAGRAALEAVSRNPYAAFDIKADGEISSLPYRLNLDGDVTNLDLKALGMADTATTVAARLSGSVSFDPATNQRPMLATADLDIASLNYHAGAMKIDGRDIALKFNADTALTTARLTNRDLAVDFSAGTSLDTLLARMTASTALLDRCVKRQRLAVDSLQQTLPPFALTVTAGNDNVLGNLLADFKAGFNTASLNVSNDSLLNLDARVLKFRAGETKLDTISLDIRQRGSYLTYEASVNNAPGTLDAFARIAADGYVSADRVALIFKQQNIQGETGYSFGSIINMPDTSTVALRFVPYHPIIGYKDWEMNRDNIITYNLQTHHIDANLYLHNDVSSLKLFTRHNEADSAQEAVTLQLSDIKLQDWLAINPFAPAMKGDLSADMSFSWTDKSLDGAGTLTLADFTYGRQRVGTFTIDTKAQTSAGIVRASADMFVDGQKALTLNGNLNDSTQAEPFLLDLRVIHLPLKIANPFLGADVASLSGSLNGEMDVTGDLASPVLNGWLQFDSAAARIPMLGSSFRFSDGKIPVDSSIVRFNDYTIRGLNKNPLSINGYADIKNLADVGLDLALKARNMQVVNGKKGRRGVDVYGKAYIDLDAAVKGTMSFLNVDAALKVLPGTNVTYVMPDAVNAISSRSQSDMVRFVNFADTAAVAAADTIENKGMLLNLDASLTVSSGTTLGVDLSADGKDRVQVQGEGTINYTMDYMGDERTTGRLNINQGYARYSPPMISEKNFTFQQGSYVAFNGNMLNPVLNIHADDDLRANVNSSGNSRMVTFDIILNVTGTMEQMNASFDLACADDITIENELKSMTAEQRANQAMNLMITGTYTGGNTKTVSGTATSTLYSFLESQINNWAASTIKGVDLSFGINQYEKTVDGAQTQAMTYSYRVSKSLFDDRFKIVVGGNYTTDAQADENFAENLIADISFEYMLNKQGTMYVRLFRHTGYESILEGEITQTGVGFVYKRKLHRLSDMFRFLQRHKPAVPALPDEAPAFTPAPAATQPKPTTTTTDTEKEK